MVHIYTFCDKTISGRKEITAKSLCELLYKLNLKVGELCVFPHAYDFSSISFKSKDTYFLLMQKSSSVLNDVLAELSGGKVEENQTLKKVVTNYYNSKNIPLDNSACIDWLVPNKAIAVTNPNGKTQGYFINIGSACVFVLPADEQSLKSIISDCLLEYLENNFSIDYKSETYKTFGLEESHITEILKDVIKNKDKIFISVLSKGLACDVIIKAKCNNEKYEEYTRLVYQRLEKYIYTIQNVSLENLFLNLVENQNIKLGLIGDASVNKLLSLVNKRLFKHISDCIILPNNVAISKFLNQTNININDPRTVYSLAVKLLERSDAELVLVSLADIYYQNAGLAYIAIGNKNKIDIYKNQFVGEEDVIFDNIANTALFYMIKKIQLNDVKTI